MEFNTIVGFRAAVSGFPGCTGAQVMAMFEDVPALQAIEARRQRASDRQGVVCLMVRWRRS
jgi:hypothetical protein